MKTVVSLDDKYNADEGTVFISGTQALVRLCLDQQARDAAAGRNTAGFISGYRGSPLGNFDTALWGAQDLLAKHEIVFQPGVNEDLAATSCWGTQQVGHFPNPKHEGVFAVWYGKGPGVDRSGDALKHGNLAGTSHLGGVLVLAGDDHGAKSSTTAHQSEQALIAAMIPILYPATIQDYVDFGAYVFALSRFCGLWISMKCVTEIVETSATVQIGRRAEDFLLPEVDMPAGGLNIQPTFGPLREEANLVRYRLPAAQSFVRVNGLDRVVIDGDRRTLGIVTAGKAYTDTLQALGDLGLTGERARQLGVRLYKLAMIWPVEPSGFRAFASGHRELMVIEEKRPVIEDQAASLLYNEAADNRPHLVGKRDDRNATLIPADGELSPFLIAEAIMKRLVALGVADEALHSRYAELERARNGFAGDRAPAVRRSPAFCSGCPHNTSTRVPEGSLALAGIGCHVMAMFMPGRSTMPPTQMGGEGANWIGAAPFTNTSHVFQNLGDGTYFHSGLMAIRASVAAGVNVTYKILYNDAVAMTGGQPVDGQLSVADIAGQVQAEGVSEIYIVSDEPEKYRKVTELPQGMQIHHRDDLIIVEKRLRDVPGVSVLIYDQTCAAEKRRRRKRNQWPDPAKRYVINELVCEGCGDCGVQSNCVSIQPLETEFGRKRQIDQSSCNKDYSCVKGFCPSFVTVLGGQLRRQGGHIDNAALEAAAAGLDKPDKASFDRSCSILVAGIGGTGVVTIGALIGMAARIDGLGCTILDITGLSQKNGAVLSHVKLTRPDARTGSSRIGPAQTDLLLGCDLVVAGAPEVLDTLKSNETHAVINNHLVSTADFQQNPDMDFQSNAFRDALEARIGVTDRLHFFDATGVAEHVFGNHMAANLFLTGYAFQCGHIPLSDDAILEAIALNGVAVTMNRQAFLLGRLAAVDADYFREVAATSDNSVQEWREQTLDEVIERRSDFLTSYQDASYAAKYQDFVKAVRHEEEARLPGQSRLTEAVARNLFKLMAYKDEYEVARLHTDRAFQEKLAREFEGDWRIQFNFAPPLLAGRDPATGHARKRVFGLGMLTVLRMLRWGRRLRGTPFDIFGYTAERRQERALIQAYKKTIRDLPDRLTEETYDLAVEIASIPDQIKGFGHIKARNIETAKAREEELLTSYSA